MKLQELLEASDANKTLVNFLSEIFNKAQEGAFELTRPEIADLVDKRFSGFSSNERQKIIKYLDTWLNETSEEMLPLDDEILSWVNTNFKK